MAQRLLKCFSGKRHTMSSTRVTVVINNYDKH